MRCSYAIILCFTIFIILFIAIVTSSSLYSPDDPLWELDVSNFDRVVLGKSNFWIIEFYNNWCGHCIRFAPVWKLFAQDIRTWRNVIDVAVVNCAEAQNTKLCRDYDVNSYPTIKLFQPYMNGTAKGDSLTSERSISSLEIAIINYLESHWNESIPDNWPVLHPFGVKDLESVIQSIPENKEYLYLFIEHHDSFVGRKVILDLSFHSSVIIRRVLSTNHNLLNDLKLDFKNSSFSSLMKVYRDGTQETNFRFSTETNDTYIRDQVFQHVVGHPQSKVDSHLPQPDKKTPAKVPKRNFVHMTDLENAVYYSLRQEIGVVKDIYGEKRLALESFLSILKTYFPGSPQIMEYLSKLHNWVSKTESISGEEFIQALDQLQDSNEYLPKMREWVSCKGSEPKYRGYPCSLWTLFHTLTVQAYNMYEDAHGYTKDEAVKVIFTIRNYVKYFFTCEECAKNFGKMAESMEKEVNSPHDAVLWLWDAHNKVNERLAGDVTEDPKHLKIQFPSFRMCKKCRIQSEEAKDIEWDRSLVLRYLRHFYGKQSIMQDDKSGHQVRDQDSFPAAQNLNNSSMGIKLSFTPVPCLLMLFCFMSLYLDLLKGI